MSNILSKPLHNFAWNLLNRNVLLPVLDVILWLRLLLRVGSYQFDLLDLTKALLARPLELEILKEVETDVLELNQDILGTTAEERLDCSILLERKRFGSIENL